MDSAKRLLSLEGKQLEVWGVPDGMIAVSYEKAYVKLGGLLVGAFGKGETFEEACEDYFSKISGKTLVFKPYSTQRQEVKVL